VLNTLKPLIIKNTEPLSFSWFQVQRKRENTSRPLIMQYENDMEASDIALLNGKGRDDGRSGKRKSVAT